MWKDLLCTCRERLQLWKLEVMFSDARACSSSLGKVLNRRLLWAPGDKAGGQTDRAGGVRRVGIDRGGGGEVEEGGSLARG